MIVDSPSDFIALAASSTPGFFINISVFLREFMAVFAMIFFDIDRGGTDSSKHIFFRRHSLKMVGVNTGGRAAKMVGHQPFWNWPFMLFIDHSVGSCHFSVFPAKTITASAYGSLPNPAARHRIDFVTHRGASSVMCFDIFPRLTFNQTSSFMCRGSQFCLLPAPAMAKPRLNCV